MVKQSGILYYLGEGGALILGALIYTVQAGDLNSGESALIDHTDSYS